MASSAERDAARDLGALLTGTEARLVAGALDDDESVTSAFAVVDSARRTRALELVRAAGLRTEREALIAVLLGIEGARSHTTRIETLWTMPGHLAGGGALTSSLVNLVDGARTSVVCSTFNFQRTSGMWRALRDAAHRPGVSVRVYVDGGATSGAAGPSAREVAEWLAPADVLRTADLDGRAVRNHAKFIAVDHRWLVVTSANLSWSAEYGNVELGVVLDDPQVVERVEREVREAEPAIYERLSRSPGREPRS